MISLYELNAKIAATLESSRFRHKESTPIAQGLGKILANDIVSTIEIPGANVSAMDGYALSTDVDCESIKCGSKFRVVGESKAGKIYSGRIDAGQCVRIFTGALVPNGAMTVVMQENIRVDGDDIVIEKELGMGKNIRYRGEELSVGDVILKRGTLITPTEILLLASCGVDVIETTGPLKVGIFSTGDELVQPGNILSPGEVYDSNRITIKAFLSTMPVEIIDYNQIEDSLEATLQVLTRASTECDIIITSGGVSVGDYDYLKDAVERLGTIHQFRVKMKPGKPFVFGSIDNAWYFGLPGNPVSAYVGFTQIISPAIYYLLGGNHLNTLDMMIPLESDLKKRPGRQDFQRGILSKRDGKWYVSPLESQDSHRVFGLSRANCFIVLDADDSDKVKGELVRVIPFQNRFSMGDQLD